MLPRSVRKWFASVTGMHGFFSGKKPTKKGPPEKKTEAAPQKKSAPPPQKPAPEKQQAPSREVSPPKEQQKPVEKKVASPPKKATPPVEKQPSPKKSPKKQPKEEYVEETKEGGPDAVIASRPSRDEEKKEDVFELKNASSLAMQRLGIDPAKMMARRPAPKKAPVVAAKTPPKPIETAVDGLSDDGEASEDSFGERDTKEMAAASVLVEKKEEEEPDVDDALARIDALLNPTAKPAAPTMAAPDVRALFNAVEQRNIQSITNLLTNSNVPVDSRDPRMQNYTPLFVAVEDGDRKIVDCLLKAGADLEARDATGRTPLFAAACAGGTSILDHLIVNHHANPNVRDSAQHHVFWACCALGLVDSAAALLDACHRRGLWTIDINAKDPCGLNAYDFALSQNKTDVLAFLEKRGAASLHQSNVKKQAVQFELMEVEAILQNN